MNLTIKTLDGGEAGSVDLPEAIFGLEPRADILHRMVRYQLAKRQQGTHKAKNRNEVSGTTAKAYRQKGSGKARHGSRKAPIFIGGGKAHGPVVRSHAFDLPKKVRALALRHALSSKARAEQIVVLDDIAVPTPKTKELVSRFGKLGLAKALVIGGDRIDENFGRAARNVPHMNVLPVQGLNVYDVLRCETLVLTRAAIAAIEERFQ